MACITKKVDQASIEEPLFISNQIQVDLVDTFDPDRLEVSFYSLGLRLKCTISKPRNIHVYQFDTQYKSLEEMLFFLGNEVGVQGVKKTYGCETME